MILYSDEYQTIRHSAQTSMLELNWTSASSKLADTTYKTRFDNIVQFIEESKPAVLLADLQNLIYNASYQFAPLTNNLRQKLIQAGVQKLAFIKSDDTITQLLVEQLVKKIGNHYFVTRYFDDTQTAKAWLTQVN